MVAAYPTDEECLCHDAEAIQALCDRIAAEHAARSDAEAIAITRDAIRRWRRRDLEAAQGRRATATTIALAMSAQTAGRNEPNHSHQ